MTIQAFPAGGFIDDHADLTGLGAPADDHTQYILHDGTRDFTGNQLMLHISVGDGTQLPTATHMIIGQEFYTGTGSRIGIGMFPNYNPTASANNQIAAVQGNVWFGTTNWGAGSSVRSLDFFPAPNTTPAGSANLEISGIITGGLLNVGSRTVTASIVTGVAIAPVAFIFGGPGITTFDIVRGLWISSPSQPSLGGLWGRLTGIQIDPQAPDTRITNAQGLWLRGDGIGADIVFGAGTGLQGDALIYFDGTDLIIDPDNVGAGIVLIGATGDDDMQLNDIEIDGVLNHDGATIGFYGTAPAVQSAAYTITNVTPDRAYDANSTSINELADVLGTLIADLQLVGIIG